MISAELEKLKCVEVQLREKSQENIELNQLKTSLESKVVRYVLILYYYYCIISVFFSQGLYHLLLLSCYVYPSCPNCTKDISFYFHFFILFSPGFILISSRSDLEVISVKLSSYLWVPNIQCTKPTPISSQLTLV